MSPGGIFLQVKRLFRLAILVTESPSQARDLRSCCAFGLVAHSSFTATSHPEVCGMALSGEYHNLDFYTRW